MSQSLMLEKLAVDLRIVVQQQAQLYAVGDGTPNRFCLTLYDVINHNDVTSAL